MLFAIGVKNFAKIGILEEFIFQAEESNFNNRYVKSKMDNERTTINSPSYISHHPPNIVHRTSTIFSYLQPIFYFPF